MYYQTPRVWMMGYANDRCHRPLTGDEMMQDVISNYAHRTVIVEYIYNVHFQKQESINQWSHSKATDKQ